MRAADRLQRLERMASSLNTGHGWCPTCSAPIPGSLLVYVEGFAERCPDCGQVGGRNATAISPGQQVMRIRIERPPEEGVRHARKVEGE